jgi:RND superfamily putative drug exporter
MTPVLYAIGRACVEHRLVVIIVWLLVAGVLVAGAARVGEDVNDQVDLSGTGSQRASNLLEKNFPDRAYGSVPIAFKAPSGSKLTDSTDKNAIEKVTTDYGKKKEVLSVTGPFDSGGGDQLNSADTIGYISLSLADGQGTLSPETAQSVIDVADPLKDAGLKPAAAGYLGTEVSKPSTRFSEITGILAAIVVLLFTFGTFVAMGLPIVTALFGLASGLSIVAIVSHLVTVPSTAPAVATMIGLGVGIDYALFIVTRHREQMAAGIEPQESAARAAATGGGSVVFAGTTVIIALLALAAAGIPLVTALGYTSAIVVAVAALSALTLLAALLGLLGRHVNSLPLHHKVTSDDGKPHGWTRWAVWIGRHPWPALVAGLAILAVLATPVFTLRLGQPDDGQMPESTEIRKGYDLMNEGFGAGSNGPMLVAVALSKAATNDQASLDEYNEKVAADPSAADPQQQQFLESSASDPRLQTLRTDMQKTKGVDSVTQPSVTKNGKDAVYTVTPTTDPSSQKTTDTVNRLRDSTIPKATKGQDMTAYVGGTTAAYIDLASQIGDKMPVVIGIVLVLSFFLLLLAFRSPLVSLKAVVMNVISIGAAFGVVTFVFQTDWTATLTGLSSSVPIVSYVPLMMFAVLFGLSMDYEVFLMNHVREHWVKTGDPHESMVTGLAGTGRVITSAALIMFFVFLAFVINGNPTIKQFGLGMAVAVAVDATIVRCMVVPAIMTLAGDAGWWVPKWLDKALPPLSIEGDEWFAERDRHDRDRAGVKTV